MSKVILLISAGSGPKECEWVLAKLADHISRFANQSGCHTFALSELMDVMPSCMLQISGERAEDVASHFQGTIKWIGQSPYRPNHKRKNWFVSVRKIAALEQVQGLVDTDIQYETMKAGGPGGQHVNTTDSAVRAVHKPTGVVVVAREERSQHANRRLAKAKIGAALLMRQQSQEASAKEDTWISHHQLERGNAVLTFSGPKFKARK